MDFPLLFWRISPNISGSAASQSAQISQYIYISLFYLIFIYWHDSRNPDSKNAINTAKLAAMATSRYTTPE